jgi:hypothetical protein
VYVNKTDHIQILPIYPKSSFNQWKREKSEKAILTTSSGPQRNLEQLFSGANSKSKIVASVHCAYARKDKMVGIWPT